MAVLKTARRSKTTNINNANTNNTSTHLQHQVKPTMFHDFLGMKATDSPVVLAPKATDARVSEASPSASASVGASFGGGGTGRGPISSTSDLGSDIIMALAGSKGGSWSTTYLPKSATRPASENYAASGEPEAVGSLPFSREFRGRITVAGNTSQGTGFSERISIPTGVAQGTIVLAKEARNSVQAAEPCTDDKRERKLKRVTYLCHP